MCKVNRQAGLETIAKISTYLSTNGVVMVNWGISQKYHMGRCLFPYRLRVYWYGNAASHLVSGRNLFLTALTFIGERRDMMAQIEASIRFQIPALLLSLLLMCSLAACSSQKKPEHKESSSTENTESSEMESTQEMIADLTVFENLNNSYRLLFKKNLSCISCWYMLKWFYKILSPNLLRLYLKFFYQFLI